ncbi:MAG: protein kinase [Bradymonadaceae bacterium]|nr:protein kinase [Lujinxingiaceae bacterium]
MVVTLGPFDLQKPIGRGGMGEVWRALHREQGDAVAIKVMTAERAQDPRFREAFMHEVRAVARLDHPGVIQVYDAGVAQNSAGDFAGRAYLAMELGIATLLEVDLEQLRWHACRAMLLKLLDALAHAHARGVVHRDLKPANILFVQDGEGLELKLTDFGLARALDDDEATGALEGGNIMGTPSYMAPEQVMARWRDQGPWTDLYALGCVAFGLLSGQPPFGDVPAHQALYAHVFCEPPALAPRFEVPVELAGWISKLLAKDPHQRYRRAADAAHDLLHMEQDIASGEPHLPLMQLLRSNASEETALLARTEISGAPAWPIDTVALAGHDTGRRAQTAESDVLPPMPADWRAQRTPIEAPKLVGVGLGLYGLRPVPLIGRVSERDALWRALLDVTTRGRPSLLVLNGPTGVGKTRLAGWLAERAHEVGAVNVLKATHSPISGPSEAVARMLAGYLRCAGLERDKIVERVHDFVGAQGAVTSEDLYLCLALTELVAPAGAQSATEHSVEPGDKAMRVRFSKPRERHLVFEQFLMRLAHRRRPVMLWIDDAQWGADALSYVEHLLSLLGEQDLPVLIVLTVRDDEATHSMRALEVVDRLLSFDRAQRLDIGPLPEDEHETLVTHLLGLEPSLAVEVAARTAGNPLFAVQLVGDWVSRGVLVPGTLGFALRSGERAPLPDDIYQLLAERLAEIWARLASDSAALPGPALELAAALGVDVDWQEWAAALPEYATEELVHFVDALVGAGLAQRDGRGFSFANGAVRECLERTACERGRWHQHHSACATMLRERYFKGQPGRSRRLGQHLIEAGEWLAALDPLLEACVEYNLAGDSAPAHAILDAYDLALERLNIAGTDPRRARGLLRRAAVYLRQQRSDQGLATVLEVEALARSNGWKGVLADALFSHSSISQYGGMVHEGIALASEAAALYAGIGDVFGEARCLNRLGELVSGTGDIAGARDYHEEARRCFEELAMPWDLAVAEIGLGHVAFNCGDFDLALVWLERAMNGFRALGDMWNLGHAYNTLGEIFRARGDAHLAQVNYQKAIELYEQMGNDGHNVVVRLNLALVLLAQDQFDQALPSIRLFLEHMLPTGRMGMIGVGHAVLLPCMAAAADTAGFDYHATLAAENLHASGFVDQDLGVVFELAARQCMVHADLPRARRAYELALLQWSALGNDAQVAYLRERLGE